MEDSGDSDDVDVGLVTAATAVGVFLLKWPKRFIPFEMRLDRPSFNSRPLNRPVSWAPGAGEATDLRSWLSELDLLTAPLLSLLKAEGKVLYARLACVS